MKKLKITNKLLMKNCDSKLKIIYSMDYISKNFVRQLSITNLKTCLLIILLLEVAVLASIKINNYKTNKNIEEINELANNLTDEYEEFNITEEPIEEPVKEITENVEPENQEPTKPVITAYNTKYEESFDKLLAINNDTKAWLRLNNTNINYPIVQASDNDYYLSHDYNKDNNINGWIFIDYRNNMNELDDNTIIYGHNTRTTTMFATLKYVLKDSWYNNQNNQIITFNTPNKQMKAQIFSIYVIDTTNDYLRINFSDEDYINFINLIKARSIHNFNVEYTTNDKMITLSTCNDKGDKRLVVHAKIL